MIKKAIVSNKIKQATKSTRKANLKVDVKRTPTVAMPRLAGNHNQILL